MDALSLDRENSDAASSGHLEEHEDETIFHDYTIQYRARMVSDVLVTSWQQLTSTKR